MGTGMLETCLHFSRTNAEPNQATLFIFFNSFPFSICLVNYQSFTEQALWAKHCVRYHPTTLDCHCVINSLYFLTTHYDQVCLSRWFQSVAYNQKHQQSSQDKMSSNSMGVSEQIMCQGQWQKLGKEEQKAHWAPRKLWEDKGLGRGGEWQ